VRVKDLQRVNDPFDTVVWWKDLDEPLTTEEIETAVERGDLQPPDSDRYCVDQPCSRQKHIERIAWLVVNGWNQPLNMDVGVVGMALEPTWFVTDGNHRFAAAIVRGDDFVYAYIQGDMGRLQELVYS
jgi:hypothetical protein